VVRGTESRDAWAASKQATVSQVAQAAASVLQELSRGGIELDRLTQQLGQSKSFPELYAGIERLAEISRNIAYNAHNLKLFCDLQVPPASVYTDHYVNQFFLMSAMKRTWWVEGATFCTLAFRPTDRILEIGCGTGYFTEIFFSPFVSKITAIDIDPRAIETARRVHAAKNINYEVMDARQTLPEGPFEAVVWTPSIFAYRSEELDALMDRLRDAMSKGGLLCGWTFVEAERADPGVLWHDMNSLAQRLKRYFSNARVTEHAHPTIEPPRQVLVFYASDEVLPFDPEWRHGVRL
jgi:SAM-dependent methyltransferase